MQQLAGYRILETLGEGGMGVVYLAEKTEPFLRRVALKVMHTHIESGTGRMRFQVEQEMLARLTHPNIAQLYEAGTAEDGAPFFAMEMVEGRRITEYCAAEELNVDERLRLFSQVCSAVQFAHQRGILHRDLKPSNILVQENLSEPAVKLIDFGIAKALDRAQDSELDRGYLGTPAYMAPEAFEPALGVDTRSDVYSLGLVLHEILTDLNPAGRSVLDAPPPHADAATHGFDPNTATVQLEGGSGQREARPGVRGELGAIIDKATARERESRYESVAALVEDLRRHLRGFPVEARPAGPLYRASKWIGRNRVVFAAATLVVLAIVGGVTAATLEARRANREARASAELAEFLTGLFEVADPSEARGRTITAKEVIDRGAARIRDELSGDPTLRARMAHTMSGVYRSLGLYDEARPMSELAIGLLEEHAPRTDLHAAALTERANLASEQKQKQEHERARALFDAALDILTSLHGEGSVEWALAAAFAAHHLHVMGKFEEGTALAQRVVRVLEGATEHQSHLAFALASIGENHSRAGRHDEGIRELKRALELARSAPQKDPKLTGDVLNDLALAYSRAGDQDAAIEATRELLAHDEEILGPNHPFVASDLHNLAMMLYLNGEPEESLPLLSESLRRRLEDLEPGESNYSIGELRKDLGLVHLALGELELAKREITLAMEIMNETVGAEHYRTGVVMTAVAKLLRAQGEHAQAIAQMRRAREVLRRTLGEDSPRIAKADAFIAEVESHERGNVAQAGE